MKIGFVLPCYNEFDNIFILINQVKKIFVNHQIIVIDDSSTNEIKQKIVKYKNVKYFKRKKKIWKGLSCNLWNEKNVKRKKYQSYS